ARVLWSLGQGDKPVIDALTEGVRSGDFALRIRVLGTLAGSAELPRTLVPLLEVVLRGTDPYERLQAARLLYRIEKKPERVLPLYLAAIRGDNRMLWDLASS